MKASLPSRAMSRFTRGLILLLSFGAALLSAQPSPRREAGAEVPTEPPPALPREILDARPDAPPPDPPPTRPPDPTELFAQLELLHEFLSLSPEELKRIQTTIALIERLSPEERVQMQQRLAQMKLDLRRLDESLDPFANYLSGVDQTDFRRLWISLPPHERIRLQNRFQALAAEARVPWMQQRLQAFREHERSVIQRLRAGTAGPP